MDKFISKYDYSVFYDLGLFYFYSGVYNYHLCYSVEELDKFCYFNFKTYWNMDIKHFIILLPYLLKGKYKHLSYLNTDNYIRVPEYKYIIINGEKYA